MDEMVKFFTQLLSMSTTMVDDIMPDVLLHLERDALDNLMVLSQNASSSLQVFSKLCSIILRRNLSHPSSNVKTEPGQDRSAGDNVSVVTDFLDFTTHDNGVWRKLLADACTWYITHKGEPIPKVYYCGVCNKQAKLKQNWESHLGGKTHAKLMAEVDVVQSICERCGLHLCGDYDLVTTINNSDEHRSFDAAVQDSCQAPLSNSTSMTSVKPVQSEGRPSSVPSSTKSDPSIGPFIQKTPCDFTKHDNSVWRKLLADACTWCITHKGDPIPKVYYCGVCDKQANIKQNWESHLSGRNHTKLLAEVDAVKFVCERCGLHLCGDYDLVTTINNSDEHRSFDAAVQDSCQAPLSYSTSMISVKAVQSEGPTPPAPSSVKSDPSIGPNPIVQKTPRLSKVVFQNTEIHNDFVDITEVISHYIEDHEAYAIGYCRPCEVICHSKRDWNAHKFTAKHKSKMSSKFYKNVMVRCLQCEFVVTAGLNIAVTYMKYHIENCHRQCTDSIKVEEYMEVKKLHVVGAKKEPGNETCSFKGSSETVYSVRSSVIDMTTFSPDLRSASSDLTEESASHGNNHASGAFPQRLDAVRSDPRQSDQPNSNWCTETGTIEKTSANPYRSRNAKLPSYQDKKYK